MPQRCLYTQKRNLSWIRQRTKDFSKYPYCKNRILYNVMSIDMTLSKWAIGGLWGKFSFFVGSSWNFVSEYIKNVDTHHESFQIVIRSSKKFSQKSLWQTYRKWTVITFYETLTVYETIATQWIYVYIVMCVNHFKLFWRTVYIPSHIIV